jgi:tetratricopeptide (TPR) repeat protein
MRYLFFLPFLAAIASPVIWGEANAHQQLYQAFVLEKQGQFEQAIRTIQPLIGSHDLSTGEIGRAWTMLGNAYQEQWNFDQAQNAYEQALHVLEGNPQYLADYSNTLDFFAGLYRVMGRPDAATKMLTRALNIQEQQQDHHSMTRSYTCLASIAIEQKHVRSAKASLEKALAEAKLTSDLTDDDHAFISDTQAWVASEAGDKSSAVAGYQHSLEILRQSHGEEYALTGFAHLLLGKAYAAKKQFNEALTNMRQGIGILDRTVGPRSPRYLQAQILYSEVLDRSGLHEEAARLKTAAQQGLKDLLGGQCIGCTVSAASLR